jgi:threonine dehydrogenase-like Zn-dependent dehydrogenase/GT2 family glycosyltransferase
MNDVAIVVRAYNEENHLPGLFDAIERQSLKPREVVLVDSGSYDGTRRIARERGARVVRIPSRDFTFGYALNIGIQEVGAPIVAIVSAHTEPVGTEWLSELAVPFEDERTAMVYGRQVGVETSKLSEYRDFLRTFGPRPEVLAPPKVFANNANSAVRRDLWEEHPFDEALPGLEDAEWAKYWIERDKLVVYQPTAIIRHIHDETWPQVRRRYYREAVAAKVIGARSRREIVGELTTALRSAATDLAFALRKGRTDQLGEVVRFRWEKALGTVTGLLDGAAMDNPEGRERYLFDRTFSAVVIRGPGKAMLQERQALPLSPSEVRVKVSHVGICGTDLEILDGTLGYYADGTATYPIVPGHEFSGTVAEMGPKVEGLAEGDRVVVECIQSCHECPPCLRGNFSGCEARAEVGVIGRDGAYAEYMTAPAQFLHHVPEGLSLRAAALCEPLAVVLKGLRRLTRTWGEDHERHRCAIVGLGPIGHLAALVLDLEGHEVTVIDRSDARLALFRGHPRIRVGALDGEIAGFDSVIEATGDPDALATILESTGAGASVLLLGLPYARREFHFESLVAYDKTVIGSVGSENRDFERALTLLPALDLAPFLESTLPLDRFQDAWDLARTGRHLKVMLALPTSAMD